MADDVQSKQAVLLEFTAFSSKKSGRESTNTSGHRRYVETVKYKRRFRTKRMKKLVNKMSQSHCDVNMKEWHLRQQIAYWKAHAISLECENKLLHEQIRQMFNGMDRCAGRGSRIKAHRSYTKNESASDLAGTGRCPTFKHPNDYVLRKPREHDTNDDDGAESVEFEVNEEWIKFMELSAKHRAELKKQRELENTDDDAGSDATTETDGKEAASESLYGEEFRKILAFETAMQINYDGHVRKTKPSYWPNIPLRL